MSAKDIVVTIPKARMAVVEEEERDVAERTARGETGWAYFWEMGRVPRETPRRMYFVWDKAVRAYHEVIEVERRSDGRVRPRITMRPEIHEIDPIPYPSFRGYRWFDEEKQRASVRTEGDRDDR